MNTEAERQSINFDILCIRRFWINFKELISMTCVKYIKIKIYKVARRYKISKNIKMEAQRQK